MERRAETAKTDRHPWPLILTAGLVSLIALSAAASESYLAVVVLISIAALVGVFRLAFRSSRAFCLTLANLAGVYACLFLFFYESNFQRASILASSLAFIMPLSAFVAGSFLHRDAITRVAVSDRMREGRHLLRIVTWLLPILAVGAASFVVPGMGASGGFLDAVLLIAMAAISAIVLGVSRHIAIFLLDTGILFEEFFRRIARLAVPAFAFLTFYSLLVILFAALYAVLDHVLGGANFRIDGALRAISFPESLYFSLMTLSTVGYGDISPASSAIRVVASAEIVCGLLLLLFGFNEIFSFARSHEQSSERRHEPPARSAH